MLFRVNQQTEAITRDIIKQCCLACGTTEAEIIQPTRIEHICHCRQLICHISKRLLKKSITSTYLASRLNIDHSTVLHSIKQIQNRLDTDANYRKKYNEIYLQCKYLHDSFDGIEKLDFDGVKSVLSVIVQRNDLELIKQALKTVLSKM